MLYRILRNIAFFLVHILYKVEIRGKENIPQSGGYIVFSNHITVADPVFITMAFRKKLQFMAKKELFKNKFSAWVYTKCGAFPVDRGKGDTKAIDKAVDLIKEGEIFVIFPEGTRTKTGELLRFKAGISLIAAKTGANLLPVAMNITKGLRPGSRITLEILPLIKNEELNIKEGSSKSLKEATLMLQNITAEKLKELKNG